MYDKIMLFDICAVPVYLIIIATTVIRKMYKGRSNRLYLEVAMFAFAADLCEIMEQLAFLGITFGTGFVFWVKMSEYAYFITRNAVNVSYIFFIISTTKTWYKFDKILPRLFIMLPYICIITLLATNEITGWVFTVTIEEGYKRGPNVLWIYAFAACYLVFGVIYLIAHRHTLDLGSFIALMLMYIINLVSVITQYFYPRYIIESFATSLTVLFVVLYVQRPELQVDMSTGLPGFRAYCEEIGKIRVTGHDTRIVMISLRNAAEMSSYLRESYSDYIHIIDSEVRAFAKREKISCEVYFESPGNFYVVLDDDTYNPVQAIPEIKERVRMIAAKILETGAQPDMHIVSVTFPKEIHTIDELLRFGHNFARFSDYSRIYVRAGAITDSRDYQIETHIDEILNRAVVSGQLGIRYQPIRSVAENKFTCAEAVIELTDVVYGSIDSERLIIAAEERGLIVSLSNRYLEEVFTFMGSESFQKLGYTHICVRLPVSQCMRMDLTDTIWNLRERFRVSPANIAFEIKETSYENMSRVFNENLKKLSTQGFKIVLDGFGSGYSNFMHLLDMPINAVRLDKSIVQAASSANGKKILEGIIDTLRDISLTVIAQGADDQQTSLMLAGLGCDLIQGSYYSPPVSKDKLEKLSANDPH